MRSAALAYLARHAATGRQVARVLERRRLRHGTAPGADRGGDGREVIAPRIARVVASLVAAGLIDDAAYATMKAASLLRRGASNRQIAGTLREKGVADDLVAAALHGLDRDHGPDRESIAALRYAQRRRLGPWAHADRRDQRRVRDIAAMVRAGFAPSLARWVADCDHDAAEAMLAGGCVD